MRSALLDWANPETTERLLAGLAPADLARLAFDWQVWARDDQLPPTAAGDWKTWLLLGGRGAGKTRAGAEWVRAVAQDGWPGSPPPCRIALIGESLNDVRMVMVEGDSGVLAVHPPGERPVFEPSRRQLTWANGSIAQIYSAEEPDGLRGPQFHAAWCDELCKWRHGQATWDMLQFGLRLGAAPKQCVTTTPRPIPLLKTLVADPATVLSRTRTHDNRAHLPGGFLAELEMRYRGSLLARQELDGEIVDDQPDALWKRAVFERNRIGAAPGLGRIVVAVDPPVTSGAKADACGIVAAGIGDDGRIYVLADRSLRGHAPLVWAEAAVAAFHEFAADRIVAEVNQGGELVETLIRQVDPAVPVRMVRATRGKWTRAEPVAALYARDLVSHVGLFAELEDQCCEFGPSGLSGGRSPDRMDALVWALTELMPGRGGQPRMSVI